MYHKFKEKLAEGEAFEKELDMYFSKWYKIETVDRKLQKIGIDRIFRNRKNGQTLSIEYKADSAASKTGNIFIETISNSKTGAEGWAIKCQADIIIYYLPGTGDIIAVRPVDILLHLPVWITKYRNAAAFNEGYCSFGRLIPINDFKKIALFTKRIEKAS